MKVGRREDFTCQKVILAASKSMLSAPEASPARLHFQQPSSGDLTLPITLAQLPLCMVPIPSETASDSCARSEHGSRLYLLVTEAQLD